MMMKTTACLLLALVVTSSGCIELPRSRHEAEPPPPAPPPFKSQRPASPVTSATVTEANANAKADALDDEIARDEEADTVAPSEKAAPVKQ
jgi:hypothetical protein